MLKMTAVAAPVVLVMACSGTTPTGPSVTSQVGSVSLPDGSGSLSLAGKNGNGNGAPSGAHYTLNIIGVPKDKSPSSTGAQVIFVDLDGKTTIQLGEGDYRVTDSNGTDGTAAFQLPAVELTGDCTGNNPCYTSYSVFARPLGKPGGSADMWLCAFDTDTATEFCATGGVLELDRIAGRNRFVNASRQLLTIYVDIGDGPRRYGLLDDELEGFWWEYDNNGLRVAQLRFYPCSTDVGSTSYPDVPCTA
jgi:hypothetical protein